MFKNQKKKNIYQRFIYKLVIQVFGKQFISHKKIYINYNTIKTETLI